MRTFIHGRVRQELLFLTVLAAALTWNGNAQAIDLQSVDVFYDFFQDQALEPSFSRDLRGLSLGGYRVDGDGQDPSITYAHLGLASDVWYNERNEILVGMQYKGHAFDHAVILPGGATTPVRFNDASAALLYKHITQGDWAVSQSVKYDRITDDSGSGTDRVHLIGTLAFSPKPGYAWVFGYFWSQEGFLDIAGNRNLARPLPLVEFSNGAHEDYSFILGFPVMALTYRFDPDLSLGVNVNFGDFPAVFASYKMGERDRLRLSYSSDNWAYPLPEREKKLSYSSRLLAAHWSHAQVVAGVPFLMNFTIGREHDRKLGLLGSNRRIVMNDENLIGFNLTVPF